MQTRLKAPLLHVVGQRLPPELQTFARELQQRARVYAFETTEQLHFAWRLARHHDAAESMAPAAVVWLQSRSGEFAQAEIEATQQLDPLARSIVIAGCWSEGEPRSGRLLTGVTRLYWHQGAAALLQTLSHDEVEPNLASCWIAVHAPRQLDYEGLARCCQSLGQRTIWQADHWPAVSSEPALRIFAGWSSWEAWQSQSSRSSPAAPTILLLPFPRPDDFERAQAAGIARVIAQPGGLSDLQRAIAAATAKISHTRRRHDRHTPYFPQAIAPFARRRSA